MDNFNPDIERKIRYLWRWNLAACLFHGIQTAIAFYLVMTDSTFSSFTPPLLTSFANWNETTGPKSAVQIRTHIPFAYVTCLVPLMSALAHGFICFVGWNGYESNVRRLQNPWRWIEYAFSSSLMIVLVAILFAIYDISLLIALFAINFTVMYTGRAMDRANEGRLMSKEGSVDWEPFIAGSVLAVVEWLIIYLTLAQFDFSNAPLYIVPLLFTYFCLFCSFALVDWWLFLPAGWQWFWEKTGVEKGNSKEIRLEGMERMLRAEKGFMILSLCAKSLLLWLIFFGTRQPHE